MKRPLWVSKSMSNAQRTRTVIAAIEKAGDVEYLVVEIWDRKQRREVPLAEAKFTESTLETYLREIL